MRFAIPPPLDPLDAVAGADSSDVAPPASALVLLDHHRDQLRGSGLWDQTLAAAQVDSVTDPDESGSLLHWEGPGPAPAIRFPYFGRWGNPISVVLRPDQAVVRADGSVAKYETPKGESPRLYFPPPQLQPPERLVDLAVPLLFVEGIKKALKVVQTSDGLAVISAQGTTVWHDIAHRKATEEWRPHPDLEDLLLAGRRLYIAFDGGDTTNNVSVIHAEARAAHLFLDVGLDVRLLRVPFPPGKKAGIDDYLAAQQDPAACLKGLLEAAVPADPRARVRRAADAADPGGEMIRLLSDLSFAASLTVGSQALFDIVAADLRRAGKVSKQALVGALETFRGKLRQANERRARRGADGTSTVPDELRQAAESLLRDPDLVGKFKQAVQILGLVGEEDVALTLLLAAVSRKAPHPIHVVVKSASSAGKNHAVSRVVLLLPPDDVVMISDLSPHALHYIGNSLKEKVVVIVETVGAERAEYPLRVMMSEGELVTFTAEKVEDEKGSRIETRRHVVEGPMAVIMTTTRGVLHGENETRILELNLDESPAQTERILEAQARAAAEPPGVDDLLIRDRLRSLWSTALGMLATRDVVIPNAVDLIETFPRRNVRARRDFPKLIALIRAHALLHQFQRPADDHGRIVALHHDIHAALRLGRVLEEDSSPRLKGIADQLLQAFAGREFKPTEAAKVLGYTNDASRRLLRDLEGAGYAEQVTSQRGSLTSTWHVTLGKTSVQAACPGVAAGSHAASSTGPTAPNVQEPAVCGSQGAAAGQRPPTGGSR